ncbi:hypothetical protein SAMN05443507_1092 [Alicyclobacillus tolerans]|uniref:Uncharacterized protein n=1 Tax=Alicyclobacillus tolerans TaxID=90970 RepID=A0A1M6PYU6_9BACL|nr:hypothetical protein SAMN05443507_1092 [Alicyclobacillus montanus]
MEYVNFFSLCLIKTLQANHGEIVEAKCECWKPTDYLHQESHIPDCTYKE